MQVLQELMGIKYSGRMIIYAGSVMLLYQGA